MSSQNMSSFTSSATAAMIHGDDNSPHGPVASLSWEPLLHWIKLSMDDLAIRMGKQLAFFFDIRPVPQLFKGFLLAHKPRPLATNARRRPRSDSAVSGLGPVSVKS